MIYDSIAIAQEDWPICRERLISNGWTFRNRLPTPRDFANDCDDQFWSATEEPAVSYGVIYGRKAFI